MKIALVVLAFFALLLGFITANNYINRDKVHVYSTEEITAQECAKRGGDPKTRVGWEGQIHIQEYSCEGVPDVHN